MRCKLCDSYYVSESSYVHLLEFSEICDSCKLVYMPKVSNELIPIEGGRVDYYYFFKGNLLNIKQKTFMLQNMKEIYELLIHKENENNIAIIIENYEYETFPEWFIILKNFKKLLFISVECFNFDKYVNFF